MAEMLQFTGEVKAITEKAVLLSVDGVTGWVPDSEADYIDEPEEGIDIRFEIPEWLAENKGFI